MEEETKSQQSEFFVQTENALKQMYFDILDKHDDMREQFYQLTKEENRDNEKEFKLAKEILTVEKYYDIIADFAKIWGNVKEDSNEVPESIVAGAQIAGEFMQKGIHQNLQQQVSDNLKTEILNKYKIQEEITEEQVQKYITSFSQKERMSDVDKEENWENLSQLGEDDVVYLNEEQAQAFQVEDEEDGQEYQLPEMDEEKKSDYEFDMQQDKDQQDNSVFQLKGHTDFVTRVNISPNGQYLISGSGDDTAIVWDIKKRTVVEQLPKMNETVDCAQFNHDGSLFAIATLDGQLVVYSFKDGKVSDKKILEGIEEEIAFIDWHKKGNAIIAGGNSSQVHMWNANKGEVVHSYYGHEDVVNYGSFSPDGTIILSVSQDRTLRTWSPKTGQLIKKIDGYGFHEDSINVMSFHKDKSILVTGSEDNTACIVNFQTGKVMGRTEKHDGIVDSVLVTNSMELFITGSSDGNCRIFQLSNCNQVREKIELSGSITKLIEIPQKCQIIASSNNGRLYMFDYRKPKEVFVQKGYGETIHDFVLDKEQQGCFTACEDGVIRYFDFKNFTKVVKESE